MPSEPIREVTVLGAGVMGAAIAAHLANAGLRVRLLDIPAKDAPAGDRAARNKIAAAGLEGARKAKPAAFFSPRFDTLVTVGNLEDDLAAAVAASDVVIEAIIENLAIKQALYARIDEMGGRAIITSNTSGLRIADLMQGRSADFRGRFCITHFFNPPRYLKLVEIVAGADTKPETRRARRGAVRRPAGQGPGPRQGHAQLHRQPHRHVRDDAHARAKRWPRATPSRRSTWCSAPRPGARRAPCSGPPTSSAWTRCCT